MVLYYVFLSCFLVGATLMVMQVLMGLIGLGGDHDGAGDHDASMDHAVHGDHHDHSADHDHAAAWYVGVLTFRTLVAAFVFFGLAGLAALQAGLDELQAIGIALIAGAAALFAVAFLMRTLSQLRAEGTVRIDRAVGKTGTVYLKVPGHKAGVGKVTLSLQSRTVEYQAVTSREELPTGSKIVVVGVIGSDTVEVVPADIGSTANA